MTMSDETTPTESIEFSEQDLQDLEALGVQGDAPFNPILKVWQEVLKPAAAEKTKKVTPQWASRIIASYSGITFADMDEMRDRYYDKIATLGGILDAEIATDDESLNYDSAEEDVEKNSGHYKNLLRDWQMQVLQWEVDWTTTEPYAAVELAAVSEVHKMFFGQTGLVGFLENIQFQFTDADQAELADALATVRGEG